MNKTANSLIISRVSRRGNVLGPVCLSVCPSAHLGLLNLHCAPQQRGQGCKVKNGLKFSSSLPCRLGHYKVPYPFFTSRG